jgi:para-nitrobenzyl esterase
VTVVETRSGRVRGTQTEGIEVFRGIPYARAPVGRLRLRPPLPPEPWTGIREATQPGPCAPQNASMVGALLGLPATEASEDCLTLNVWTPAAGDGQRRPVLVWIHGGGFVFGSGSQAPYDGARLAALGDVVVVTLNYRLGALGFLALPSLADEEGGVCGNFGLLDQIAALHWVRDHAAVFGGDPDQVTIFGESAGGMSVGTLLGTPAARGLFRGAIAQSGAAHNVSTPEQGERVAYALMKELGLSLTDVESLRAVPVSEILAAQQRIIGSLLGSGGGLPFQPVVDGRVLPRQPLEAIADGEASGVSLLIGTNRDEWRLFALADTKLRTLDEARLVRRLERAVPGRDAMGRSHAERALEVYRRARGPGQETSPIALWNAIEGDRVFGVPAARLADAQNAHAPGVYSYLFTWESPVLGGALGACHGLDVPFVFGTAMLPALRAFVGEGPEVAQLCARIQGAWIAFAHGGSPGHEGLPDWPRYDPALRPTLLLGGACSLAKAPGDEELQFWDGLL